MIRFRKTWPWAGVAALLALGLGCAAAPPAPPPAPATPAPAQTPAPGQVLSGQGQPRTTQDLEQAVAAARVVLVGEVHDHPGHHAVQLEVLRLMASAARQDGHKLVVGVEWLDHGAQPACDALGAGRITVEEFARQVDWPHAWGYDLKLYAPLLEEIRANQIPLVALNAPVKVIRRVAHEGLAALTPEQRAQLAPSLDLDDQAYRALVAAQFAGHGIQGAAAQDNFLAAQIGRDETMAHHLAMAMHPWPDGGTRGLVLAGGAHLAHGLGLPPRIARRLPGAKMLTILPVSADKLEEGQAKRGDLDGAPADLVVVTEPAPPRRPRLGIMLRPHDQGVLVAGVWPGSAADQAGMEKDDVITAVDGKPVREALDLHHALKSAPSAPHRYTVNRGGRDLVLTITLSPGPASRPGER